jgi:serine/threonine protein phosphatase PrpC
VQVASGGPGGGGGCRASEPLANAMAQALVDRALAKGTADNVTALVMLLSWA